MNKSMIVNGYEVRLNPYTEKRRSELIAINEEITDYANNSPEWDEIAISVKADYWRRKAAILWASDMPYHFYESDDFEQEMLMEAERFFLSRRDGRSKRPNTIMVLPTTMLAKPCQAARSASGSTASELTSTKATFLQDSIQSWPCKYGINPPISLRRPW